MILKEGKDVQNGEIMKTEKQLEKETVSIVINVLWFVLQELTSETGSNWNV
jgi:uncharacterized membrane protein YccF (DUF307 family)